VILDELTEGGRIFAGRLLGVFVLSGEAIGFGLRNFLVTLPAIEQGHA